MSIGVKAVKNRVSTGISGLDSILDDGLVINQTYLIRGGPGTGKTTIGLQFLAASASKKEVALFVTLGEAEAKIRQNAENIGIELAHIHFLDLSPSAEFFTEDRSYDIFLPADVERESVTNQIIESIQTLKPRWVFVDSVTQFRYLSTDSYLFHQQVLSFIRYLTGQGATTLLTSESVQSAQDEDLQFLCDGVLSVKAHEGKRTIQVEKFRGSGFVEGPHALKLTAQGAEVFPKLRPRSFGRTFEPTILSSGVPEINELLHGGIERGTVTIITGPTGVGKTTFGVQFMKEAAGRGDRSVIYTFEESKDTIAYRSEGISIPVRSMVDQGTLVIEAIEAMELSPDEFVQSVRREVEQQQAKIVMIDSIAGYSTSIRGEDLIGHVHALCRYLQNMGVTTLLINELDTITGDFQATGQGISYLADNIIFLRHLEIDGRMRKAIGVLKKRLSSFEQTLREFEITKYGVKVGAPLTNLRNILSGTPSWIEPPPQPISQLPNRTSAGL